MGWFKAYSCAQCNEKGNAICKMIGLAGKDVMYGLILLAMQGKLFEAGTGLLAAVEKGAAKIGLIKPAEAIAG